MKRLTIANKIKLSLATVFSGLLLSSAVAGAIPYTGPTTPASPVPAFNVYTGTIPAPAPAGGEQDFFQGRVPVNGDPKDPSTPFVDPVNTDCTDGKIVQLHIYVHNGADAAQNNNGTGPSVAHGSKVKVAIPGTQASSFHSTATISANNAASISDGMTINCNGQSAKIQYVAGSATQFSNGSGVLPVSDSIVTSGASIQSEKVPGDVWGCWNERVYVVLEVKIVVPPTPPQVTATCDLLSVVAGEERKVKVSQFKYTNVNASVKNVVLNWGDNSNTITLTDVNQVIGQTHQYAVDNSYTITAVITFTDNTTQKEIVSGGTGTACVQQVNYTTPNQPPTIVTPPVTVTSTPAAPTQLVNTGAGSIVGIFAATSAAGAAAYRFVLGRRLSRQ